MLQKSFGECYMTENIIVAVGFTLLSLMIIGIGRGHDWAIAIGRGLGSVADPGCLSWIRLFSIPDPGSEFFPSRIRIKEFKYFNPK
jgi:hypothetical protein